MNELGDNALRPTTIADALGKLAMPFFLVAVVGFLAVGAWVVFLTPDPFDPLTYELQRIEGVSDTGEVFVPSVNGVTPAVRTDGAVPTVAPLINASNEPVSVEGTVEWQQIDPNGYTCRTVDDRPGVIPPGASARRFDNDPIPQCVVNQVEEDGNPSRWVITGRVRITEPNGVTTNWTTESFEIFPKVDE